MNRINSNLVEDFCLNCNKNKCRGNCKDFKAYLRNLRENKLIKNKGGRPKQKHLVSKY